MEFYTPCKTKRPVRLCEATRRFAYESLIDRKYGLDTRKTPYISADDYPGFEQLSNIQKYSAMEELIVTKAPLRVCDGELLSGAATLGKGINHRIPCFYKGETVFFSVSHITPALFHVLEMGTNGYRQKILENLPHQDGQGTEDLKAMLKCIDHLEILHERYINKLREMAKEDSRYEYNLKYLANVPMNPPKNFREAVQSLWFTFAYLRLLGNWPSIGRMDAMLGPYLKKDLENGDITIDEARELIAHFMIKGCEWVCGDEIGSGDAQHYQNIVLAGLDKNGNEVCNEVTYLILEVVEELSISDFPIAVKLSKSHPNPKLVKKMAEVVRHGGGVIAAYNNDMIVDELVRYGLPIEEARVFANDGCWEIQVPGKTLFAYTPFDGLQILQKNILKLDMPQAAHYDSIEDILADYRKALFEACESVYNIRLGQNFNTTDFSKPYDWKQTTNPSCLISMLEDGCIEKGREYLEGGPKYATYAAHIGGAPDTADAIYAIKKVVFDEKLLSFDEFMKVLQNNWEGYEELRLRVRNKYTYFGNDNDEVDLILARIISDFRDACDSVDRKAPFRIYAGISTFGRQIDWKDMRTASPHGYRSGDILASNISPTPGTDRIGATAVIRSACKLPLEKMTCGAALDLKLSPESVEGEDGVEAIASLFDGFVNLGGSFLQVDVMDNAVLLDAQKHPENYHSLAVRISGWSARFVTLEKNWQQMIIERTSQNGV